jgi:site-specific DNA-adenine methylase
MNYGLPYKGSKNKLAPKIFELFPQKKNFYDLFCGGCAMTHYGMLHNKFEKFIINDINPMCPTLFVDAINGKFKNETRWISREDFFRLKDVEPYIAFCWSFGNNLRNYLYGKDLEEAKKVWHYAVFFDDFEPAKKILNVDFSPIKNFNNRYKKYLESKKILGEHRQLYHFLNENRLQSLESLERLQSLERLEQFSTDYQNVKIYKDSVIYCDIPYENTDVYTLDKKQNFDFERFYSWCEKQTEPVFISSYKMPEDRFICIATFEHRSILSATANNKVLEKVFIPKHQTSSYRLPGSLFNFDGLM